MDRTLFEEELKRQHDTISKIRAAAQSIHDGVNQKYGKNHPYWFHLDMVAEYVIKYGSEVCQSSDDVLPIIFGAYFHDSIEDARLTYNDVIAIANKFLDERQAFIAAEIAYALTNEKGRTRAERANDKYYEGIRTTPYAPLVKLADRLANYTHSCYGDNIDKPNIKKKEMYEAEMPHFIKSITTSTADPRLALPDSMLQKITL